MLLLEYAQSPTTYPSGNEALVVLEFRVISICVILPNEWNTPDAGWCLSAQLAAVPAKLLCVPAHEFHQRMNPSPEPLRTSNPPTCAKATKEPAWSPIRGDSLLRQARRVTSAGCSLKNKQRSLKQLTNGRHCRWALFLLSKECTTPSGMLSCSLSASVTR